ncbi:hypothetical protein EIN_003440, partial [Entamoeba invadens IP1]
MRHTKLVVFFVLLFLIKSYCQTIENYCQVNNVISFTRTSLTNCNQNDFTLTVSTTTENKNTIFIDSFNFTNSCCNSTLLTFTDLNNPTPKYKIFNIFQEITLKYFFIQTRFNNSRITLEENNRPDNLFVSMGCFNNEENCRTEIGDNQRPTVAFFKRGIHLFSNIDQHWWIVFHRNETISYSPYILIDGTTNQTSTFHLQTNINFGDVEFSYLRYLFSGNEFTQIPTLQWDDYTHKDLNVKVVCKRTISTSENALKRFFMISTNYDEKLINESTLCGCVPNSNYIKDDNTTFNISDCRFNSSYFDLDLTKLTKNNNNNTEVNLSINKWYTPLVSNYQKYIFKSSLNEIYFEKLELQLNKSLLFEINCIVNNLITTSTANYIFKHSLTINNIILDREDYSNSILFEIWGTLYDNTDTLTVCGHRAVMKSHTERVCMCMYTNNNYYYYPHSLDGPFPFDCANNSCTPSLILRINNTNYSITTSQTWEKIIFYIDNVTLITSNQNFISTTYCDINSKVTVIGGFYIENVHLYQNAKIVVNNDGYLRLSHIYFDDIFSNGNQTGIIEIYGEGGLYKIYNNAVMSLVINEDQTACFEFISFETEKDRMLETSKMMLYLGNKLYRICPRIWAYSVHTEMHC